MTSNSFRLRSCSLGARLGLTFMLMTLGGGLIAALMHMQLHHENRDSEPGLSITDLKGVYHGVKSEAPMLRQLENGHPKDKTQDGSSTITDEERTILINWLNSDRISEDYDNLDLGDSAPAEIIAYGCLRCHSAGAAEGGGIGEQISFEFWDGVSKYTISRDISPNSTGILLASTHTHALSMGMLTILISGMMIMTRFKGWLTGSLIFFGGCGLLVDLGAQWLARDTIFFIYLIVAGGAVYFASIALMIFLTFLELWLPKTPESA